jgi:hypothetical protein
VSLTNENVTQVTWPPGWEARLATLFLLVDGRGHIAAVVVIFQGSFDSFSKKRMEELELYSKKYPKVRVFFQKKAWMDGQLLTAITKKVFLPYLRDLWASDQVDFAESLLVLDNGPGRNDPGFLSCLKDLCKAFLLKLPPNQTGHIQLIDDNVGRLFRDLACDFIEAAVESMSPEELSGLTLQKKRTMMVEAAHQALLKWMDSDHYLGISSRAALRTGLAMRIDNDCNGVRPTRFPAGYEKTILASSGAEVRAYFTQNPAPAPIVVATVSQSISRVIIDQVPSDAAVALSVVASGPVLDVRVQLPEHAIHNRAQEEVGVYDGWSDEEERVYLADEVSVSSSDSDLDSDENPYSRRSVSRRRWCLPGCDCERPIGSRKCACERSGSLLCSKNCGCDSTKCRSRPGLGDD